MIDLNAHPPGQDFTGRWRITYEDYQRAISLHCHYANQSADSIEALLVESANRGRTLELFIALLDIDEALMPLMGHPDTVQKMQALAALWAGKYEGDIA